MWRIRSRGWPARRSTSSGHPSTGSGTSAGVSGAGEVGRLGVQPQQHRVVGDTVVEGIDEPDEERVATDGVVRGSGRRWHRVTVPSPPWPSAATARASCPPRSPSTSPSAPPHLTTCSPPSRSAPAARTGRRHADRGRPGCPADHAHPPRRRPRPSRSGRSPATRRPASPTAWRGRQPAVLRRERGVHGHRQGGVGRGRAHRRHRAAHRPGHRDAARCPPIPPSTSCSSTPTRAATRRTSTSCCHTSGPTGCCSSTTRCGPAGSSTTTPPTVTRGDQGVQRQGRRRRSGRELPAPGRRRRHVIRKK